MGLVRPARPGADRPQDACRRRAGPRPRGGATPTERALVEALLARYPRPEAAADCTVWNLPYAEAMRGVYELAPDDVDVATLYADALMNLTPWRLWDLRTGKPASDARTAEAKAVLDRALLSEAGADHPGVLHLYIHLMEMSPTPEDALVIADRLRGSMPDAGHLHHMPSHLDVLCGDYRRVVSANSEAIRADERYRRRAGAMNFYTLYRSHNYHFKIYGAMFLGQSRTALETAAELEASIPEELLRVQSPPMADWLEAFLAMRVHVLIRFGRWADILALPLPADAELYCVTTAMIRYARGVAYSATGRIPEAEAEREAFRLAVGRVPGTRMLFNNTCHDILAVASAMLDGELHYRKGEYDEAFASLERSIELDDGLPFDEPWGWMQPTRHAYGALLLEQGRVAEAEAVYRADLGLDDTLRGLPSTPATYGRCTGSTNASYGWARRARHGSWHTSSRSPPRSRTYRSTRRASAACPPPGRRRTAAPPDRRGRGPFVSHSGQVLGLLLDDYAVLLHESDEPAGIPLAAGDEVPVAARPFAERAEDQRGLAGPAVGHGQLVDARPRRVRQPDTGVGEAGQVGVGIGLRIDGGDEHQPVGLPGKLLEAHPDSGFVLTEARHHLHAVVGGAGVVEEDELVLGEDASALADERADVQRYGPGPGQTEHARVVQLGFGIRFGSAGGIDIGRRVRAYRLLGGGSEPSAQTVAVQQVDQFRARDEGQRLRHGERVRPGAEGRCRDQHALVGARVLHRAVEIAHRARRNGVAVPLHLHDDLSAPDRLGIQGVDVHAAVPRPFGRDGLHAHRPEELGDQLLELQGIHLVEVGLLVAAARDHVAPGLAGQPPGCTAVPRSGRSESWPRNPSTRQSGALTWARFTWSNAARETITVARNFCARCPVAGSVSSTNPFRTTESSTPNWSAANRSCSARSTHCARTSR